MFEPFDGEVILSLPRAPMPFILYFDVDPLKLLKYSEKGFEQAQLDLNFLLCLFLGR